jgi:hypothetical protein
MVHQAGMADQAGVSHQAEVAHHARMGCRRLAWPHRALMAYQARMNSSSSFAEEHRFDSTYLQ